MSEWIDSLKFELVWCKIEFARFLEKYKKNEGFNISKKEKISMVFMITNKKTTWKCKILMEIVGFEFAKIIGGILLGLLAFDRIPSIL